MDELEKEYLDRFYFLLRRNLEMEKKLRNNSVLLSFLRSSGATRFRLLSKSAMSSNMVPDSVLTSLLAADCIQCMDNIDTYAITAKGVWHAEDSLDLINHESLVTYINDEYFVPRMRRDLNEKEKAILFAMVSARTFSEGSVIDLKKDESVKDKWREILERSFDRLCELGQIAKLGKENFLGKSGNIHIVSSIFRHNNHMVQKTRGIYSYNRKQEYYLDLYKDSVLLQRRLSYLFWKIFRGNLSVSSVETVIEYCNQISSQESIYLFDMQKHIFSMPVYDIAVKDALMDSIISGSRWAKI